MSTPIFYCIFSDFRFSVLSSISSISKVNSTSIRIHLHGQLHYAKKIINVILITSWTIRCLRIAQAWKSTIISVILVIASPPYYSTGEFIETANSRTMVTSYHRTLFEHGSSLKAQSAPSPFMPPLHPLQDPETNFSLFDRLTVHITSQSFQMI